MKTISKNDVTYYVDEENSVIVCKLTGCAFIAADRIKKYCMNDPDDYRVETLMQDSFIGKAKCAPEDDFNIEIGKQIALKRAKAKRKKAINRVIERFRKSLEHDLSMVDMYLLSK